MDIKEFGSVYKNKQTGKKIKVKKLDCSEVLILDEETGIIERSTFWHLKKDYKFIRKESVQMKFGKVRRS